MELEAEALWEGLQEVVTEVQGVEVGQAERELGGDLRDRVEGCRHPLVERDRVPDVPWDLSQAALMKITFHMLQRGFFFFFKSQKMYVCYNLCIINGRH